MEDRVIVAEIRIFFILVPVDQVTLISQIAAERIQFVGGIISAACGQYVQQRGGGVPDHLIGFSVEIIQIGIIDTEIDAFPVEVGRIKSEYSSQISQLERIIFRKAPAIPAERAVPQFCVLENCTASSKVWACEANVNPRRTDNMITFFIMCWFKFIF